MKKIIYMKCFIIFSAFLFTSLYSFGGGKTVYSIGNPGSWTTGGDWSSSSGGGTCSCTPSASNDNIHIETNITSSAGLAFGSQVTLEITSSHTLTINGDVSFANGAVIQIDAGAAMVINGNLQNNNNSNQITINGTLSVNGNFTGGNGSTVTGSGNMSTSGSSTTSGSGTVFGESGGCTPGPCVVSSGSGLPVELLSFEANAEGQSVSVKWSTATERNNNYFTVEKSMDGNSFSKVVQVEGAGNSNTLHNYEVVDTDPFSGLSYYRLKQTDFNGTSTDFNIVPVNRDAKDNFSMNVYPSVASSVSEVNVQLNGKQNANVLLVLRDVLGKEYYSKVILLEKGNYFFSFANGISISSGVYFITASSDNNFLNKKIVIR